MFFAKLGKRAAGSESGSAPSSNAPTGSAASSQTTSVKIKTVKVKRSPPPKRPSSAPNTDRLPRYPAGSPESRSGSSTPKRPLHSDDATDAKSRKMRRPSSSSSLAKTDSSPAPRRPRRRPKTPDLSRFNRACSDDDNIDDSNWEAEIRRFSSAARIDRASGTASPAVSDSTLQSREFYAGTQDPKADPPAIIHAKSLLQFADYTPLFGKKDVEYSLAMPCTSFRETYIAAVPRIVEEFSPVVETEQVMELVANYFVPPEYTPLIKHPSLEDCIVRRYRRAVKDKDPDQFLRSIEEYNTLVDKLRDDGTIDSHLQKQQDTRWGANITTLPLPISRFILDQVYARVVSPVTERLRDYKAFSNNVYGELLPGFMTRIFKETGLTADMKFIDLGSGVGNCALQAALEIGCESWGCEVMKTASGLAAKQKVEMIQRVQMFGINLGAVELRSADFVHNDEIHKQISEADVLLVNNYAFDGKLNSHLIDIFLDLKEGARIVSLKSFVPSGHVISQHNIQSPVNLLRVEPKEFPTGSVSWTIASGPYYISTVDRSRLEKYLKENGFC